MSGSRGPPQLMFDDGSRVMVEDNEYSVAVDSEASTPLPTQRGSIPLHTYYEIDRMSREVVELLVLSPSPQDQDREEELQKKSSNSAILRVALQFPDELLEDSPEVCWLLEDKMREDLELLSPDDNRSVTSTATPFCFVLGDTTVNSCCPDEVAALPSPPGPNPAGASPNNVLIFCRSLTVIPIR